MGREEKLMFVGRFAQYRYPLLAIDDQLYEANLWELRPVGTLFFRAAIRSNTHSL
jgi:hypothetical protein